MKKKKEKPETALVESEQNKLVLQKTWFSKNQLLKILQKTPKQHVYTRPGKGGRSFEYVTGVYVKKVLNYVTGWNWDFVIEDKQVFGIAEGSGQIVIQGKLIVRDPSGKHKIEKTQFGRADVKYLKGTSTPVDIGNDFKAAATDCLKKCASELGIASDVYGAQEFKEIHEDEADAPREEPASKETIEKIVKACAKNGVDIRLVLKKFALRKLEDITEQQAKTIFATN